MKTMTKILFVGEKRSALARKMGVTWEDGRLAAKHLFTAIDHANLDVTNCEFKKGAVNIAGKIFIPSC